jgi:O-antigen/teichoic acid export membrane protein
MQGLSPRSVLTFLTFWCFVLYFGVKKLSKNAISLFTSEVLSHVLGFVATIYIARLVGVEGFGMVSFGLAFLNYALLIGNPGLTTLGTREIARNKLNTSIIEHITGTRIILASVIFVLMTLGVLIIPGNATVKGLILVYSLTLFPFALYLEFVFQGREEMEFVGIARFIQYASYLVLLVLLLKPSGSILTIPLCFFLSYAAGAAFFAYAFVRKYYAVRFSFSFENARSLVAAAVPVGLATILYQVALNLPPIMLGFNAGQREVGYFAASYKIIIMLLIIERVFYYVFFPIASRQYQQSKDKLNDTFTAFIKFLSALTIPLTAGGIVLSSRIIGLVYGADFAGAIPVLRIMLFYFMITPINTVLGYGLIAMEKEKVFLKNTGIAAFICVVLVFAGSYYTGGPGVAGALLIAECIGLALMTNEARKTITLSPLRQIWRQVASALVMTAVLVPLIIFFHRLNLLLLTAIGIAAYLISLYLFKGFTAMEVRTIAGLFREKIDPKASVLAPDVPLDDDMK